MTRSELKNSVFAIRRGAKRAEEDVRDLNKEITAFIRKHHHRAILKKEDREGGKSSIEIVAQGDEVPQNIGIKTKLVSNSIMSLADHALGLAILFGGGNDIDVKFPTSRSDNIFERPTGKRVIEQLPEGVGIILRELQPYKRGRGECFWVLRSVENVAPNKIVEARPSYAALNEIGSRFELERLYQPVWNTSNKSLAFFRRKKIDKFDDNVEVPLEIVFGGIQSSNVSIVIETLTQCIEMLFKFLRKIERALLEEIIH